MSRAPSVSSNTSIGPQSTGRGGKPAPWKKEDTLALIECWNTVESNGIPESDTRFWPAVHKAYSESKSAENIRTQENLRTKWKDIKSGIRKNVNEQTGGLSKEIFKSIDRQIIQKVLPSCSFDRSKGVVEVSKKRSTYDLPDVPESQEVEFDPETAGDYEGSPKKRKQITASSSSNSVASKLASPNEKAVPNATQHMDALLTVQPYALQPDNQTANAKARAKNRTQNDGVIELLEKLVTPSSIEQEKLDWERAKWNQQLAENERLRQLEAEEKQRVRAHEADIKEKEQRFELEKLEKTTRLQLETERMRHEAAMQMQNAMLELLRAKAAGT